MSYYSSIAVCFLDLKIPKPEMPVHPQAERIAELESLLDSRDITLKQVDELKSLGAELPNVVSIKGPSGCSQDVSIWNEYDKDREDHFREQRLLYIDKGNLYLAGPEGAHWKFRDEGDHWHLHYEKSGFSCEIGGSSNYGWFDDGLESIVKCFDGKLVAYLWGEEDGEPNYPNMFVGIPTKDRKAAREKYRAPTEHDGIEDDVTDHTTSTQGTAKRSTGVIPVVIVSAGVLLLALVVCAGHR